jgi:N-acetylglucosamine-6-phosphate deacetylase
MTFWLTNGKLVTPSGVLNGALRVDDGRIGAIRPKAPRGSKAVNVRGAYVAPGFIDLHIWGGQEAISREAARHGTTAFLSTLGPDSPERLREELGGRCEWAIGEGAACLGVHLEGPFVNPRRGGALPRRWMRPPTERELQALAQAGCLKLITIAPELPGALEAVRWCRRHGIAVSLGHSEADAAAALHATDAGASAVTHVFNGMRAFHHREPSLLDIALTDPRLTAMVILDGVHVSPFAFRLLLRAKGASRVALVTDSIRHQEWDVVLRRVHPSGPARADAGAGGTRGGWAEGAYYTKAGTLAGSRLTMMRAVRNAAMSGGASLADAVRMASATPAALLGLRDRGSLEAGLRADLVVFDRNFHVRLTLVGGRIVYQRGDA